MSNQCVKSTSGLYINFKGQKPEAGIEVELPYLESKASNKGGPDMSTFINSYDQGTLWVFADNETLNNSGSVFEDEGGKLWLKLTIAVQTNVPVGTLKPASL